LRTDQGSIRTFGGPALFFTGASARVFVSAIGSRRCCGEGNTRARDLFPTEERLENLP